MCSQATEYNGYRELRNTSKQSKFIRDFWKSKAVNDSVCDALQYNVIPTMDVELGMVL